MSANRLGLLLVAALFCAPLFMGLGRGDLRGDEAAYSFGVDRMLESGDWLVPKSSPHEDAPFLEKPPLKFWIVAASIRLGLLPDNEFGLRFWDALFGAVAFVYVFAIGCRLAGGVCGVVAVLMLFAFEPLLFDHGLRSGNMEAPLFLTYCGGIYHYLGWTTAETAFARRGHAAATALYFVLGFMTKFVAALFLPLILGAATLAVRKYRSRLARDWRLWTSVSALALALIAPWFVYAFRLYGSRLWDVMFTLHIYTRMTSYLDPAHVQPWSYYWVNLYKTFLYSGSVLLVLAGTLLLLVQTIRRRWDEGVVVLLWFALPVLLISLGSSKLTHYVYPFIPPLALGGGYLAALLIMLAPAPLNRLLWTPVASAKRLEQRRSASLGLRALMLIVAVMAGALAANSLFGGQVRFDFGGNVVFRNSAVLRPATVALLFAVLASGAPNAARLAVPLFVAVFLPVSGYAQTLARLDDGTHPLRTARDCLLHVETPRNTAAVGLYVDVPDSQMWHWIYYYFRSVRPWTRARSSGPVQIARYLEAPAAARPILISDSRYQEFVHRSGTRDDPEPQRSENPAMISFDDIVLLLPGPYAACRSETITTASR